MFKKILFYLYHNNKNIEIISESNLFIILNSYNIKNNNLNNIFELYPYKYYF